MKTGEELIAVLVEAIMEDWNVHPEEIVELKPGAILLAKETVAKFGEDDARAWLRFRSKI